MLFKRSTIMAAGIATVVVIAFAMVPFLAKFRGEAEEKARLPKNGNGS